MSVFFFLLALSRHHVKKGDTLFMIVGETLKGFGPFREAPVRYNSHFHHVPWIQVYP